MNAQIIQIVSAGFAAVGFAMMFSIRPRHLPVAFAGGALGWALFLFSHRVWDSRAIAMMAAAFGVTVYSEIAARVFRIPVSVIYTPAVIPMIPGGHLYYCLRGFVTDSHETFYKYGNLLWEDTLGIVLGSVIVLTFVSAVASKKRRS